MCLEDVEGGEGEREGEGKGEGKGALEHMVHISYSAWNNPIGLLLSLIHVNQHHSAQRIEAICEQLSPRPTMQSQWGAEMILPLFSAITHGFHTQCLGMINLEQMCI